MSERILWIQAGRTILMLLVVFVHANLLTQQSMKEWWPGGYWSGAGYGLAVPGFFLVSGYVLALSYTIRAPRPGELIRGKLWRIVAPFLLWNAIMVGVEHSVEVGISAGHPAFVLIAGYWHLYFVFALIQCFLLYVWLHPRLDDRRLTFVTIGALVLTAAFYGLSSVLLWNKLETTDFFEQRLNRLFVAWVGFFFVGVWLARKPRVIEWLARPVRVLAMIALAAALYMAFELELRTQDDAFWDMPRKQFLATGFPYQLAGTIALMALLAMLGRWRVGKRILRALASIADDTFGIYLCHNAVLILLYKAAQALEVFDEHRAALPLLALTTAVVSFGLVRAARYLGAPVRFVFGQRKRAPVNPAAAVPTK